MAKLTMLVGPPGSGKSTYAKTMDAVYINQDSQGKDGHITAFRNAVREQKDIVVDRMNFNKEQRKRYLEAVVGYEISIVVFHENYKECLDRCRARFGNHETINEEQSARSALQTFFTKYERPSEGEAQKIEFKYPDNEKISVIYSDLDGTLCNIEHRVHHVNRTDGKRKDWKSFFAEIPNDTVNEPVMTVLNKFKDTHPIIYCSGRDDNQRKMTQEWLNSNRAPEGHLYMRNRQDMRPDYIIKEIILDFELLTRYNILFCLDDRNSVVDMLRKRGLTVFQVAPGDF